MSSEPNLAFRRSKRTGMKICVGSAILAALFGYGVVGGSYWALAIPVAVGVMAALWLAFWVGWTISTIDSVPPEADPYDSRFSKLAGKGICIVSVLLALVFIAGVWELSYWVLAIPVSVAVLGLLLMVFHIGWAIATQGTTLPAHAASAAGDAVERAGETEVAGEAEIAGEAEGAV